MQSAIARICVSDIFIFPQSDGCLFCIAYPASILGVTLPYRIASKIRADAPAILGSSGHIGLTPEHPGIRLSIPPPDHCLRRVVFLD